MKHQLTALLLLTSAVACNQDKAHSETAWEKRQTSTEASSRSSKDELARRPPSVDVDESDRQRVRGESSSEDALRAENASEEPFADERGTSETPMDQGQDESDVQVTKDIRRALMDNAELSFTAKNVKVITRGRRVTLRGAVESERERIIVENTAKSRMGVTKVRNELEVIADDP